MRSKYQTTTITNTTETPITPGGGSGVKENLFRLNLTNNGAADTDIEIRDSVGGSVIFTYTVKAGQTVGFDGSDVTVQTTANTQWTAKCSVASSVVVQAGWLNA